MTEDARAPAGEISRGLERRPLLQMDMQSLVLALVAGLAILSALRLARDFFVPLATGLLVSYALDPLVSFLGRRGVPRAIGAAIVVVALLGASGTALYSLSDEVATVIQELPAAAQKLRQAIRQSGRQRSGTLQQLSRAATEIERAASEATTRTPQPSGVTRVQVVEPTLDMSGYMRWGSVGAVSFAGQLLLLIFLVFFLLASGDLFKRKLVRIAGPTMAAQRVTVQILDEINTQIAHFLLHLAVTSAVVGIVTGLAFWWIGLNQPAVWGLAAAIFNTIPYFGPVLVMIGSAAVAFVQFGSITTVLTVAFVSVAITSLEGMLLTPWLMGRAGRMNAVAVFVGLLFWGWMWGLWGMLLAAPMLMAIKTISERVEPFTPIAELLGE